MPCSLSSLDHGHSYSVFNASQGVEVLNLGYDGCIQALCNSIQSDQRRIADGLGEIFVDLYHKSTSSFHEIIAILVTLPSLFRKIKVLIAAIASLIQIQALFTIVNCLWHIRFINWHHAISALPA